MESVPRTEASIEGLRLMGGFHGQHVYVSGYSATFGGNDGMFYWWDSASTAVGNLLTVISVTGAATGRWLAILPAGGLSVKFFGAKGDGLSDDTGAIQEAIDVAFRCKVSTVYMPEGRYVTSGPIHLGYGQQYNTVHLRGARPQFLGDVSFSGTTIDARGFSNAPAINFQAARGSSIESLTIIGASTRYTESTWVPQIHGRNVPYATISVASNWVTGVVANGLTRYAPYAGVTIDAYYGAAPMVAYPSVNYPDWTGIGSVQYNKAPSFNCRIIDCTIDGFFIGVANQPNADGNGDYTVVRGCTISSCAHAISVGNTQSRNVEVSSCAYYGCHTFISTDLIGAQNGRLEGALWNNSGAACFQIFSLGFGCGSVLFDALYAEEIVRIGTSTSTARYSVALRGCTLANLGWVTGSAPAEIYNVPAYEGGCPLEIRGGALGWTTRGLGLLAGKEVPVSIHDCTLVSSMSAGAPSDDYIVAYNYFGGGVAALGGRLSGALNTTPLPAPTDPQRPQSDEGFRVTDTIGGSRRQVHHYATQIQYGLADFGPLVPIQRNPVNACAPIDVPGGIMSAAGFAAATRQLTFTFPGAFQANYNQYRLEPGVVLWDQQANALFVIDSVVLNAGNYDVAATMMTNYQIDSSGVYSVVAPVTVATDRFWIYQTFHKVTSHQFRGDLNGTTIVSAVHRADGAAAPSASDFMVGDLIWAHSRFFDNAFAPATKIVGVSSGTLTLDTAATITATDVPIELYR